MEHCNVKIATKGNSTLSKKENWWIGAEFMSAEPEKTASNYHLSACNLQEIHTWMHQNAMEKSVLENNGSSEWFFVHHHDLRLWFYRSVMCAFLCSITASAHANRLTPLAAFFFSGLSMQIFQLCGLQRVNF